MVVLISLWTNHSCELKRNTGIINKVYNNSVYSCVAKGEGESCKKKWL